MASQCTIHAMILLRSLDALNSIMKEVYIDKFYIASAF